MIRPAVTVLAAASLALAAGAGAQALVITTSAPPGGAPAKVGGCAATTIASIGVRVSGRADSGTEVAYANGVSQVSHAVAPQVAGWRVGDPVRMCLVHAALNCPVGRSRGGFYEAVDQRTNTGWTEADTTLACGG